MRSAAGAVSASLHDLIYNALFSVFDLLLCAFVSISWLEIDKLPPLLGLGLSIWYTSCIPRSRDSFAFCFLNNNEMCHDGLALRACCVRIRTLV